MNILIVSEDSFFISGAISLIVQTWQPGFKRHPVFLVSTKNRPLLEPDIIITDACTVGVSDNKQQKSRVFTPRVRATDRHVVISLAAQSRTTGNSTNVKHHLRLEKNAAVEHLKALFGNQKSALFSSNPIRLKLRVRANPVVLSKQQAMVVRYTRQGLSLTDISRVTSLSVKTISTHKRAIMRKLGMKNNSEFYQYTLVGSLST